MVLQFVQKAPSEFPRTNSTSKALLCALVESKVLIRCIDSALATFINLY